jgi:hypothetical protein
MKFCENFILSIFLKTNPFFWRRIIIHFVKVETNPRLLWYPFKRLLSIFRGCVVWGGKKKHMEKFSKMCVFEGTLCQWWISLLEKRRDLTLLFRSKMDLTPKVYLRCKVSYAPKHKERVDFFVFESIWRAPYLE